MSDLSRPDFNDVSLLLGVFGDLLRDSLSDLSRLGDFGDLLLDSLDVGDLLLASLDLGDWLRANFDAGDLLLASLDNGDLLLDNWDIGDLLLASLDVGDLLLANLVVGDLLLLVAFDDLSRAASGEPLRLLDDFGALGVLSDLSRDFGDLLRPSLEVGDLLLASLEVGDLLLASLEVGDLLLDDFVGDLDDFVVFDDLSLDPLEDLSLDDLAFFDAFVDFSPLDFLVFSFSSDFVFLVLTGAVSGFDFRLWLLSTLSA